jgi:hypothetical protein
MVRLAFIRHIGIDGDLEAGGVRTWTAFTGTDWNDPKEQSVIWSSLVEW